jgi:hypothetical protein
VKGKGECERKESDQAESGGVIRDE